MAAGGGLTFPGLNNSFPRGMVTMIDRLKETFVSRPLAAFKAAGRWFERRLARRLSQRYADEITQFAELRKTIDALTARIEKQEAYQWDHVALTRRLAALEDHVNGLFDLADFENDEMERNIVRLPLTETVAVTTAVGQLRRAG